MRLILTADYIIENNLEICNGKKEIIIIIDIIYYIHILSTL